MWEGRCRGRKTTATTQGRAEGGSYQDGNFEGGGIHLVLALLRKWNQWVSCQIGYGMGGRKVKEDIQVRFEQSGGKRCRLLRWRGLQVEKR